jgi:hypothetical protein
MWRFEERVTEMALTKDQNAMRQALTSNPGKIDNSGRIPANSTGIAV